MFFIVSNLEFHGVTTFVTRFSRRLSMEGQRPAVVVLYGDGDPGLQQKLAEVADIYSIQDFFEYPQLPSISHLNAFRKINAQKFQKEILERYGFEIHVTGVLGLATAFEVAHKIPTVKVSVGIYHQREFDYEYPLIDLFSSYFLKFFSNMDPEQILFFNEYSRDQYAKRFNKSWSQSLIVPIGVELNARSESLDQFIKGKIVSVGQLLPFKTYNEAIIRLLPELILEVPDIQYFIYGDGSERERLEGLAKELKVDDQVRFCGTVKYENFASVVKDANVFVGSGTALLEAAALGVPAIVGIEGNQKSDTYGFLSEVKGLSYNESIEGIPRRSFADCLRQVLSYGGQARPLLGEACERKAQEFSINQTVKGFKTSFEALTPRPIFFSRPKAFLYFLLVALLDKLGIDRSYRNRRNQ